MTRRLLVLGLLGVGCIVWVGAASASPGALAAEHKIGYRILRVPREGAEPMVVAFWYPAKGGQGSVTYQLPTTALASDAAPDAPPAEGPFPLVIYCHGGGGCGLMGATFAEALAESGFVVAAPDFSDEFTVMDSDSTERPTLARVAEWLKWAHGASSGVARGGGAVKYEHRPREVRAAIDYVLAQSADPRSPLAGLVDPDRIGAMGVSFGAWTTQAVAGFIPAFRDERVKAAVPIAGNPGVRAGSLAAVRIPVMIVFGEEEHLVLLEQDSPVKTEGMIESYESAHTPKFLVGIEGARHLDFGGAGVTGRGRRAAGAPSSRDVRRDDPVIGTVNHYCIAFFRRYLLGDEAAGEALTRQVPRAFILKADPGDKGPAAPRDADAPCDVGQHR